MNSGNEIFSISLENADLHFILHEESFVQKYSERWEKMLHTHVYYELLYVLEGEVAMTIRGREHRVEAGSLVFLSPFDAHATRMLSPVYRRYYLLIPPDRLRAFHNDVALLSVFRFHGEHFSCVLPTGGEKGRFDAYFALLLDAAQRGGPDFETRVEALMTLILVDARAIGPELFLPPEALSFLPIQELLDRLEQRGGRDFSLEEEARKCHVSPGCLSAHFRRLVGISPMQYVMQLRLGRAKLLLRTTELSIPDVARQCGWGDASNFVRRFREQFHCTPLKYRQGKGG